MRKASWFFSLILITFLTREALANGFDSCTMFPEQIGLTTTTSQHQAESEHSAILHNLLINQSERGCCTDCQLDANCMISGIPLISPPPVSMLTQQFTSVTTYFADNKAVPPSPYFPLLRPPIT